MLKITMPVKEYVEMFNPHYGNDGPKKVRFFTRLSDVPTELTEWMSTNPREQNLTSTVAKAISGSIRQDTKDFHLKNRGILLSADTSIFVPTQDGAKDGQATLTFTNESLHGNIDGGHTLRLILAAQSEGFLPEQYVEFEVLVGLQDILSIAEARNTSVALDMRTMEEMKGSFTVLKEIFGEVEVQGNRFFDRIELKMNQQLEESNHIDVRTLISILLMFNQKLYPVPENGLGIKDDNPVQMYGNPEGALKKYLALGNGDSDKRNESIQKMAPILPDIVLLWDTIEREFPFVNEKKYQKLPMGKNRRNPVTMFSNTPVQYAVPQSVIFPIIAAFRLLVEVTDDGDYKWADDPFSVWSDCKQHIFDSFIESMKATRNNLNSMAKKSIYWTFYAQIVLAHKLRLRLN